MHLIWYNSEWFCHTAGPLPPAHEHTRASIPPASTPTGTLDAGLIGEGRAHAVETTPSTPPVSTSGPLDMPAMDATSWRSSVHEVDGDR